MVAEDGDESEVGAEDRISHDRSDECGDDGFDLEVVDIEDLARQQRTTQGSAKDGADTRPDPGRDSDPSIGEVETEPPREQRPETLGDIRPPPPSSPPPTPPPPPQLAGPSPPA